MTPHDIMTIAVVGSVLAGAVALLVAIYTVSREPKRDQGQTQVLVNGRTLWVTLSPQAVETLLRAHEQEARTRRLPPTPTPSPT